MSSTLFRVLGLSTIIQAFVPILVWKGVGELAAARFLGRVFAALSFPTHIVVGWLADRLNKARVMAVCMLVAASGLLLLTYAQNTLLIWLFLPLFSLVEGRVSGDLGLGRRALMGAATSPRCAATWASSTNGAA